MFLIDIIIISNNQILQRFKTPNLQLQTMSQLYIAIALLPETQSKTHRTLKFPRNQASNYQLNTGL
jgi:hypothetical protein